MKYFIRSLFVALALVASATTNVFAFDVPILHGRVNDTAVLLSPATHDKLEATLRDLEQKTTVQVAILTVKDMQGQDIKSFALKVAETWKLGQKDKDNGLLLMYTIKEDKYRMEVGYGLEGALPDGKAGDILRQYARAKADPKKGTRDFDAAFTGVVEQVAAIVSAEYAKDPSGASMRSTKIDDDAIWIFFAIAVVIAGFAGAAHAALGGTVGALEGAGLALYMGWGIPWLIVLIVVGCGIGFIAHFLLEIGLSGVGGGSFGDSSSGSDSFGGGGGSFGGGGADA
ncbi:MAG: TPM domain-containing protein [bacterium]|nr:TPM domain-containing protein [bacterium]